MRLPSSGLYVDDPAYPLLKEFVSYWGISSGAGAADGTTIVDTGLADEPSYQGHLVKILSGDAAGQVRLIVNDTTAGTGQTVVDSPFTDNAGAAEQIVAGTLYCIISIRPTPDVMFYGTTTSAGAVDGSTLVDTSLSTPFTVDDEPIGHTVVILTSSTAALVGQRRQIYDYDVTSTTIYFNTPFTNQVPTGTTYIVLAGRPEAGGGGPGPQPEPATEETAWKLADFDNFDVADATADTLRWSSEYQVGAAHGSADINTTTAGALFVNITAAVALAAAQYGVRRLWTEGVRKFLTLSDVTLSNIVTNVTQVWAGIGISRGAAWDATDYILIYKAQDNANERIRVEYNLAGAGAITTNILTTTQDAVAFKIERENTMWRLYYSLTQSPRHNWVLALEIEDPTNAMTDLTSIYLTVSNPEDAVGQRISASFHRWEYYETLGNLGDIINLVSIRGGALAYLGYCPVGMAASTTVIDCPNLIGFENDAFNSGYQMIVLKNANAAAAAPEMEMRDIQDYVSATGRFTVEAFSATVEASDIVLIIHNSVAAQISAFGIADAGSGVGAVVDAARTEADDWWNAQTIMMLSGAARGQKRPIGDFVAATDTITPTPNFDAAVAAGDIYVILAHYNPIVPRTADNTTNLLTSDVVGRQDDTIPDMNLAPGNNTIVRQVKAILERVGATPADPDDSLLTSAGQRDAVATADTLADVTTTDIQAKLRRILLRMSSDAFTATIQGAARTELDTMLDQLATYFVAVGAAMAIQINGNAARTNLQQVWQDFSAIFAADGVNVFNPTIQGAARTNFETALNALATYLTAAGAAMSIQVNGNAARDNLEQVIEDLSVVLGADGVNVFNPTIQGAARTDLDTALAQLATYFVAAGAAMALQVNGNAARTNLQQALNDYFAVVGCDGANVFSTTIQGVARTTIEAAFDGLAAYFVAAGAALSVTIDPGGAARSTLATLWNDLGQMLAGAAGITTWPVRALPANGVSLAEGQRYIAELKPHFSTPTSATWTTTAGTEETAFTVTPIGPGLLYLTMDMSALVAGDDITVRVYQRVDGATYRLLSEQQFVGNPAIDVYQINGIYCDATALIQVRTLRTSGTNRAFPYRYSVFNQPVV